MVHFVLAGHRPRYTELILAGEKTVELRKRRPLVPPGSMVVMYASHPTCAIVGAFVLERIVSLQPAKLWRAHGSQTGVSQEVFNRYYENSDQAFGLVVGEVMPLEHQVTLDALRRLWSGFHPPQSYRYLHRGRTRSVNLRFSDRTEYFTLQA